MMNKPTAVFLICALSLARAQAIELSTGGPYAIYAGENLILNGTVNGQSAPATWTFTDTAAPWLGARTPLITNSSGTVLWSTLQSLSYYRPNGTLTLTALDQGVSVSASTTLTTYEPKPHVFFSYTPVEYGQDLVLDASPTYQEGPYKIVNYKVDLNSGPPTPNADFLYRLQYEIIDTSPSLIVPFETYAKFFPGPGQYRILVAATNYGGYMDYYDKSISILPATSVPEPGAAWLGLAGLAAMAAMRSCKTGRASFIT